MKENEQLLKLYNALDTAFNAAWYLSGNYPSDENWKAFLITSDAFHTIKDECEKRGLLIEIN